MKAYLGMVRTKWQTEKITNEMTDTAIEDQLALDLGMADVSAEPTEPATIPPASAEPTEPASAPANAASATGKKKEQSWRQREYFWKKKDAMLQGVVQTFSEFDGDSFLAEERPATATASAPANAAPVAEPVAAAASDVGPRPPRGAWMRSKAPRPLPDTIDGLIGELQFYGPFMPLDEDAPDFEAQLASMESQPFSAPAQPAVRAYTALLRTRWEERKAANAAPATAAASTSASANAAAASTSAPATASATGNEL
jgi:hypothetical protein